MPTHQPAVTRTFIQGKYGQIHCRVSGNHKSATETIVCLHMSPKSGRTFATLLPWLADSMLALAPDYPGYGESDPPPAQPHITVEDYAQSVWEVIDELSAADNPVHLLGYHTGSMVAVEAAHLRPKQVASVVNISAPLFTPAELEEANATYLPIPLDEDGTRFRVMWERILFHRGPGMTLEMAAQSLADNLRGGEHYEWGHRAAFTYAPRYGERLSALEVPILVLNPNDDCHEQSRRADPLLRNGKRVDLPDWGHGFLELHAEKTAQILKNFISELTARQDGNSGLRFRSSSDKPGSTQGK